MGVSKHLHVVIIQVDHTNSLTTYMSKKSMQPPLINNIYTNSEANCYMIINVKQWMLNSADFTTQNITQVLIRKMQITKYETPTRPPNMKLATNTPSLKLKKGIVAMINHKYLI